MKMTTTLFFQPTDTQQPRVTISENLDHRYAPEQVQKLTSDADSADGIFILQNVLPAPFNTTIEVQFPTVTRLKNVDLAKEDLATLEAMPELPAPLQMFYRRPLMGIKDRINYALVVKGVPAEGGGKSEMIYIRPTMSAGKAIPMPALVKKA